MNFKRALILSPHTDDGEIGAGGTMARLIENGTEVNYVAFNAPLPELEEECRRAIGIFKGVSVTILSFPRRHFPEHRQEILQYLYDMNEELKPDLVLTPCTRDCHQDHEVVTKEAIRAFRSCTILGYELPWNIINFDENCFVSIDKEHLNLKIAALSQYHSQHKRHYFKPEYVRALAYSRGGHVGVEYAETFEVIKLVFMI